MTQSCFSSIMGKLFFTSVGTFQSAGIVQAAYQYGFPSKIMKLRKKGIFFRFLEVERGKLLRFH